MNINGKKELVNLLVLLTWLSSFILTPASALAHQAAPTPHAAVPARSPLASTALPDPDFDGILTTVEEAGWYNETGGPYLTDPNNPDSDGDGLSDGYEQLYDTHPNDAKSPGLYVEYQDHFLTKKYYPWHQEGAPHGDKFIIHSALPYTTTQDIIVRRGTTVHVGAPPNATLNIIPSDPGLAPLTPLNNSCGGGWSILIPENGTTGTYTLQATDGAWSEELTLHVIFELDQPQGELTQEHIDVLAYNDDVDSEKDLVAIYWDTSYENPRDNDEHDVYGWGIGWETDYNQQYVFEDYVMPGLQGFSDKTDAAIALRNYINASVIDFDANSYPNSTWNALKNFNYDQNEDWYAPDSETNDEPNGVIDADCNGHASIYTTFLRASGLPARPVAVDWVHKHYDTSTEVWIDGQWKVERAYSVGQPASDISSLKSRSYWGSYRYKDNNDMILVSGPGWQWDLININYAGVNREDYFTGRYESLDQYPHYPDYAPDAISEIKKWDWVETPVDDYWNFEEATVIADCSANNNNGCEGGDIGDWTYSANPLLSDLEIEPETAYRSRVVTDYGVDEDNDGRYDQLVVEVEVQIDQAGDYYIDADLNDLDPETRFGSQIGSIERSSVHQYLEAGVHTISLAFDGKAISQREAAGPYVIDWLRLTNEENLEPHMENGVIEEQNPNYRLDAYSLTDFEDEGASLSGAYTHQAQDTNGDGYVDLVTINTALNITEAGEYRVTANLVDAEGDVVASASWVGSDGQVQLPFSGLLGSTQAYYLRDVDLYGPRGLIDSDGHTNLRNPENYPYSTGQLYNAGTRSQSTQFSVAGATPVDSDSDGDYDRLDFAVNAYAATEGTNQYKIEGWLENNTGALVALRSAEVTWPQGLNQGTLSFDGPSLHAFKANGPYKLVALKFYVWFNGQYVLTSEKDIAYETQSFSFNDFDGSGGDVVMSDQMEAELGTYWNLDETAWYVTEEATYTGQYAWTDSLGGNYGSNQDVNLTSQSFTLDNAALPILSFRSCHSIATDGDVGRLQVSVDGGGWQTISNFSGMTSGWNLIQPDLSLYTGAGNLKFRYRLTTNGSGEDDGWFIDDVNLVADDDADNDGLKNDEEGAKVGPDTDTDGDNTPDYLDDDSDNDGISDAKEGDVDTDLDGTSDYRDTDSDNDNIPDQIEGEGDTDGDGELDFRDTDSDGDGVADTVEGTKDSDNDGTSDFQDSDSDNDGISDETETGGGSGDLVDSDGDSIPDYLDSDSDDDGITDLEEGDGDADEDGIPNYLDGDSDGDGLTDEEEGSGDSDGDGIPDSLDSVDDGGEKIFLPIVIK